MTTPTHAANYFIDGQAARRAAAAPPLTLLKLQSLVINAQGWHLALLEKPLFDEPIRAWPCGPVVESQHHEFKRFGSNPIINAPSITFNLLDNSLFIPHPSDPDTLDVLARVRDIYQPFDARSLYNSLHGPNTPWQETRETQHDTISTDLLKTWYTDRIQIYLDIAKELPQNGDK